VRVANPVWDALFLGMRTTTSINEHGSQTQYSEAVTKAGEVVNPVLLTIPQAARMLAVGRTTLYELVRGGELEVVRIGRSARVPVDAVHAFVRRRQEEGRVTLPARTSRLVASRPSERT
jgi:excisionase family DNA binding protein